MKTPDEMLEDLLEDDEEQLARLNAYLKELKVMTDKHGTAREQFEEDLMAAEHNIKYYETKIVELKEATSKATKAPPVKVPPAPTGTDTVLPRTAKQGIGSLIISSISFLAGALLGSKLKSRKADKDAPEDKRGS